MRNLFPLIALALFLSGSTGCATLIRGEEQTMTFNTEPQGATVTLDNGKKQQTLTTPAKVDLKRKERYQVLVNKDGFRPVKFDLEAQWDGATLGNAILPGGSLGAATDRASGADLQFYKLQTIQLPPASAGNTEPLLMVQHRGKLYTFDEYKKVLAEEEQHREDIQLSR